MSGDSNIFQYIICDLLILVIKNAHKCTFCNYKLSDLSGAFNILKDHLFHLGSTFKHSLKIWDSLSQTEMSLLIKVIKLCLWPHKLL